MVDAGIFEARARGRRKGEAVGLDEGLSPVKKRRGRPRKSETAVEEGANGDVTPGTQTKKRKKVDPLSLPEVDDSLVGQPVHGVLDGSFDAGYILTVRVGDTDTILRGVVFGPGLSVPITKANDIAPNVKFAEPQASPLSSPAPTSTPASASQELVAPAGPSSASTFTGGATPTVPPQDSKDHTVVQAYTPVQQDYTPVFGVQTLATGVTEQPMMETVHSVQRPVAERPQPGREAAALGLAQHLANGSQVHVVKAESIVEATGEQQQQLVQVPIGEPRHSQAGPAEHQHVDE